MIYLWRIDENKLELNLKEILKYPKLSLIWSRDKTNGKLISRQEFKYIDFLSNRDSYPIREGLGKDEAHKFAVKNSGLPSNYTADTVIKESVELCKTLNGGVIENMIDTTVSALHSSSKFMEFAKDHADKLSNEVKAIEDIEQGMRLIEAITKTAADIPTKVARLLTLREEYDKIKDKKSNTKRGGGDISNSYDGDGLEKFNDSGEVERLD